jgi:septal ring factor EnvC (AmiA/AmiB activator)
LKTRVLKSEDERIGEIFAIVGQVNENNIRNYYESELAKAPTPDRAEELTDEMEAQIRMNRDANPYLQRAKETQNPVFINTNINTVLYRTRDMLNYLEKEYGSLNNDEQMIRNAIEVYQYYKGQTNGLQGTGQQKQAEKRRVLAEMEVQLSMIKEESANATQFINAIIQQDPDYTFGVE